MNNNNLKKEIKTIKLLRFVYLSGLQDRNEKLFYKVVYYYYYYYYHYIYSYYYYYHWC